MTTTEKDPGLTPEQLAAILADHISHNGACDIFWGNPGARCLPYRLASLVSEQAAALAERLLKPPTEAGMVAYEVEVLPHDWPNDGLGWEKGTGTPAEVAAALRGYASQVEFFTSRAALAGEQ
jgi:hypothetical protein